jgi:hypothetical protein
MVGPDYEAPPRTSGTGEDVCPKCRGSGRLDARSATVASAGDVSSRPSALDREADALVARTNVSARAVRKTSGMPAPRSGTSRKRAPANRASLAREAGRWSECQRAVKQLQPQIRGLHAATCEGRPVRRPRAFAISRARRGDRHESTRCPRRCSRWYCRAGRARRAEEGCCTSPGAETRADRLARAAELRPQARGAVAAAMGPLALRSRLARRVRSWEGGVAALELIATRANPPARLVIATAETLLQRVPPRTACPAHGEPGECSRAGRPER